MEFSDPEVLSLLRELTYRYPDILRWYNERILPRSRSSVRITLGCESGQVCGISIADLAKNKLCTLYVREGFRGRGLGWTLLQSAFTFLNTHRPYFTCSEAVAPAYAGIVKRYEWVVSPHDRSPELTVPGGPEKCFNLQQRRVTLLK